tara:strand:- start:122 stop:901 length:780 start_codon:yes stop_codon:yes gene_type:complete
MKKLVLLFCVPFLIFSQNSLQKDSTSFDKKLPSGDEIEVVIKYSEAQKEIEVKEKKKPAIKILGSDFFNKYDFLKLFIRACFNFLIIGIIILCFYYPSNRNKNYVFTYLLISVVVFFLCFLLENVKLELSFALGLFAIFGIIRYRTETIPIKEMTYLFVVVGLSVINALANKKISYSELLFANFAVLGLSYFFERIWLLQNTFKSKVVLYEKIDMITAEKRSDLLQDLELRTGLKIEKIEIENIDLLRDTAKIKIYYIE